MASLIILASGHHLLAVGLIAPQTGDVVTVVLDAGEFVDGVAIG